MWHDSQESPRFSPPTKSRLPRDPLKARWNASSNPFSNNMHQLSTFSRGLPFVPLAFLDRAFINIRI